MERMIKSGYRKLMLFLRSTVRAVFGIFTETLFAAAFIAAGFAVCALLWAIFR